MASWLRPRNLAIAYGAFVAGIFLTVWWFTRELAGPWYGVDTSRWVYAVYAIVGANILVGVGTVAALRASSKASSDTEPLSDGDGPIRMRLPRARDEPTPSISRSSPGDPGDKDINRLLESLHEIGTSAAKEAEGLEHSAEFGNAAPGRVSLRTGSSGSWLVGPGSAALALLALSAAMLPNVEGFLQSNYALNAILVLGMSFSLIGLGAYLVVTVLAAARG